MAVLKTTSPSPRASAPSGRPTKARPSSSTRAAYFLDANDHRLVEAVLFRDLHLDPLAVRRGHVLADVVGTDGQLAMTAVHKHRELNRTRPAEVQQRIHRRARGAAAMDDVVDEHDDLAVHLRHV